ncbi:hypothetical protein P389DRAFT_207800 [Cystobasidium minutum MCA 4210]|uniref:uncharacterized protein n=1 Tax=Cystobasidium minutum MCA 4210 TaxID=1397322 RepID=UPI0034CEEEF0|eukprot:jgi/Rhomi1/207800/estExt_Genemark1.C_1_t20262
MSVSVRMMCSPLAQTEDTAPHRAGRLNGLGLKGRTAQIVNGKLVLVEATPSSALEEGDNDNEVEPSNDATSALEAARDLEEEGTNNDEQGPVASTSRLSTPSSSSKASRPKIVRRQTRYFCTWEGCSKSYAKPVRLTEHMRSHTGERPFKCTHEGCNASYLRDTHLVAHMRTHLDEKDKPFTCEEDECGKTFWTNQHLNRHVKLVHEQDSGAYKCEQCDAAFNKHNKLREHVAKDHMPEGTKPFICPEEGCGKSFRTGSKLRTHSKIHDKNRYVCMHPSHLAAEVPEKNLQSGVTAAEGEEEEGENSGSSFPKFATWSALQEHNKLEHPPTCPQPECGGRTFKSNKKMRKHCIKVHLDTIGQSEEDTATGEDAAGQGSGGEGEQQTEDAQQLAAEAAGQAVARPDATETAQDPMAQADRIQTGPGRQYSFGGRARKRKPGSIASSQLIPTQPIAFQDFDGTDDYAVGVAESSSQQGETIGSKRVRFE